MTYVLVPLAAGFEEIEAASIIDVLRRAEVKTVVAALGDSLEVEGAHGLKFLADRRLAEVRAEDLRAIVLPGGMPGADNLRQSHALRTLVRHVELHHGLLAAICAAPWALSELMAKPQGHRLTCYPAFRSRISGVEWVDQPVVEDGHLLTSQGPATALAFGLALARKLASPDVADKLAAGMLFRG